jgi:transcription initiation factor TFIIA large subunit
MFKKLAGGSSAVTGRTGATGASSASGGSQINGSDDTSTSSGAGASAPQLVITNPDRLVPVQITIPAQPGNPASVPRALTVQVPAHALQQTGPTSQMLQQVLTQAITQALTLPESHAAVFLQNQINTAFRLND